MYNVRGLQVYAHLPSVPLLSDISFYAYTSHDTINISALDDLSNKKNYIHIYLLT